MKPITYLIDDWPIPPSENSAYLNLPGRGRCPSGKLKEFVKSIDTWMIRNNLFVQELRRAFYGIEAIHVELWFCWHKRSLFTKDNRVKRLDAQNRIKCTLDALSQVMALDDRHVFSCYFVKVETDDDIPEHTKVQVRQDYIQAYAPTPKTVPLVSNLAFTSH